MAEHMPLSRVSTVDALVAALRSRILSGDLRPGAHLSEVELATAYGVGRHSLRAAFRELARGGLLVHEPNRGVRVPVPTAEESEDLYLHRAALELGALHVALADERSLDGVLGPLAALRQMPEDEPWDRVAVAHDAFHAAIVDAAGGRRLAARAATPGASVGGACSVSGAIASTPRIAPTASPDTRPAWSCTTSSEVGSADGWPSTVAR